MARRWGKLEKDFRMRDQRFDISKIPDIYDCIKYDLQHNQVRCWLQIDRHQPISSPFDMVRSG